MLLKTLTSAYRDVITPFPKAKHPITNLYKVNHAFGVADILMSIEHLSIHTLIMAVKMYDSGRDSWIISQGGERYLTDPITLKTIELAELVFITNNLKTATKVNKEMFKVAVSNACLQENRLEGVDSRFYEVLEHWLEGGKS